MSTPARLRDTVPPLRQELLGKEPYGAPQIDVPIRLNANENPYGPDQALVEDIVAAVRVAATDLNRYPDRDAVALRGDLAAYLTAASGCGITADAVWAANGSNEVLDQLMRAYAGPGRRVLGFEPTYSMHRTITEASGAQYISANRDSAFDIDPEDALSAIREHQPHIVIVCSPNNPTGGSTPAETIQAIYDAAPGIVLVDEAYAEFSEQPSALTLLEGRPRLVVSRTMSKAFAFAGARLGYLAADPRLVRSLLLVRLPYHLSTLTQAVARVAIAHSRSLLAGVKDVIVQRERIVAALTAMGVDVVPSDSNFVLFRPGKDAKQVWQEMLDRGVLIRDVGLDGRLRVTAGTETETARFLQALREAL